VNAQIIRDVLSGQTGPKRDVVLLNTAAAFLAVGLDGHFKEGIERAQDSIDSGKAMEKLEKLAALTQQLTPRG
jgi:anthranilate phosphoribosyltransferase